jgi:hypothetical protein
MGSVAKRRRTVLAAAAFAALAMGTTMAAAERIEQERLDLRPPRETASCSGSGNCPLVAAPRVDDHRHSTIPGISNPDHGRPPVIILKPPPGPAAPQFRTFGAHQGIFGKP